MIEDSIFNPDERSAPINRFSLEAVPSKRDPFKQLECRISFVEVFGIAFSGPGRKPINARKPVFVFPKHPEKPVVDFTFFKHENSINIEVKVGIHALSSMAAAIRSRALAMRQFCITLIH